jgi:hypothetical protein
VPGSAALDHYATDNLAPIDVALNSGQVAQLSEGSKP